MNIKDSVRDLLAAAAVTLWLIWAGIACGIWKLLIWKADRDYKHHCDINSLRASLLNPRTISQCIHSEMFACVLRAG